MRKIVNPVTEAMLGELCDAVYKGLLVDSDYEENEEQRSIVISSQIDLLWDLMSLMEGDVNVYDKLEISTKGVLLRNDPDSEYLKKRTDVGMLSVYYEDNIGRTKKFIIE